MPIYANQIHTAYQLRDAFRDYDRDNYPMPLYDALLDYLNEYVEATGEPYELNVIALCCDLQQTGCEEFLRGHKDKCPDPADFFQAVSEGASEFEGDFFVAAVFDSLTEHVEENHTLLYADPQTLTVYYI